MLRYASVSRLRRKNVSRLLAILQCRHKCKKQQECKTTKSKSADSCGPPSAAIILAGCGNLDGSDISEAISLTIHVSQKDWEPQFFAPDVDICGVVDHLTKQLDDQSPSRNALVEAARIARSKIKPLCECEACRHEALFLAGGFGLVRTLSDFSSKGADCTVLPDLKNLIKEFECQKKPIGAVCISPALVARVLKGVKVTLGKNCPKEDWPYAEVIERVKEMGAKVEMKDVKGVTRCKKYNVFSTPAWLYKCATYAQIHEGIGKLVGAVKKHARQ